MLEVTQEREERKWTCVRDVGHTSDEHSDDKGPPAAATEGYSPSHSLMQDGAPTRKGLVFIWGH